MAQTEIKQQAPAKVICPSCDTEIGYFDMEQSAFYGCPSCSHFFAHEKDRESRILKGFSAHDVIMPWLDIGSEGTFDGKAWRLIGFMAKRDPKQAARWREYVLFRKGEPYAMLAEYDGHWSFISPADREDYVVTETPTEDWIDTDGRTYRFYQNYMFDILYAKGEFDWNILDEQRSLIAYEYIDPPNMLVREENDSKTKWYKAVYLQPGEVANAFNVPVSSLPATIGIGAIQPTTFYQDWSPTFRFAVVMAILVVATHIILSLLRPERLLLERMFEAGPDPSSFTALKPLVSDRFKVNGPALVTVSLHSDVDNEWLELPVTLVNDDNGDSYEAVKVLEYYHGYEGGESWSEGSNEDDVVFSNIPSGNYHLNIYPASDRLRFYPLRLKVTENETLWSNTILVLAIILAYPVIKVYRKSQFENQRWT